MSKIPFIKAKHAQMKLIEGGGGGGGTSLVLIGLVVYIPPDTYEYPVDEPIMYNGMVLMAQYEDNYYRDVTDIATYSIPKGTVMTDDYEGEVTFTYEEGGVKAQNSIEISVVSGVTWTSSKASKLVEAFVAAYAGDTEILSKLAVGDIRTVALKDGRTAHLILAKANPVTAYNDNNVSIGKAKFIVTMQEAYPYENKPTDFYEVLPDDLKPLIKKHQWTEYYDCSGTSHYWRTVYTKAFYPNYTFFTKSINTTPYSGRISYWPVACDTIDLRTNAGGYYDSNTVDTTKDVFEQSNRIFRNIDEPSEYIPNVAGRGYSEYSTSSSYWYMNNPTYYCAQNYGKPAYQNNATYIKGFTYCMLI